MCNIIDRWQQNICMLISTIVVKSITFFGEYQANIITKVSIGIKRKHLDGITNKK
jgi:hypothetical protein